MDAPVKPPIRDTHIDKLYPFKHSLTTYDRDVAAAFAQADTATATLPFIIDPKVRIGIEVEVENVPHYHDSQMYCWEHHEDNSLRNNGREFVTFPIAGSQIPLALTLLFRDILPSGYDFSSRTSVHVHMNVRNMTPAQIVSLICLFTVFEKTLYRFVGHDRDKNIFCVPLQQTLISNALLEAMEGGFKSKRWYKYAGLNIIPIQTQGSIEFRQLHGTDDINLICAWINMLLRMRTYAVTNDVEFILDEIKKLNTNSQYDHYLNKIFFDQARMLDSEHLSADIESGVVCVKQCTLNNVYHRATLAAVETDSPLITTLIGSCSKLAAKKKTLSGFRPVVRDFDDLYYPGPELVIATVQPTPIEETLSLDNTLAQVQRTVNEVAARQERHDRTLNRFINSTDTRRPR